MTLAGLLGFQGVMLLILGNGGTLPINDNVINDFANGILTPTAGWIVMGGVVAAVRVDHVDARRPPAPAAGSSRRRSA